MRKEEEKMYHYMQIDPSLIWERIDRMRAEMNKLRFEKRLRRHHEGSGPRAVAYSLRLKSTRDPHRGAGAAGR